MDDVETIQHPLKSILVRDYVLGFFALFGFLAAFHALTPTLPIYLERLGSSKTEIGVLVGAIGISALAARLLVGKVLRSHPGRVVMMMAAALFGLSFLALIVFRPFWPVFIVRLLQGIAFASLDTAVLSHIVRIIAPVYRARALVYFFVGPSLAAAIAATSSVYVADAYGFTVLLFACTGLCVCSLLLSSTLGGKDAEEPKLSAPPGALFFRPQILAPAIMSLLFYFSYAGVAAFFPLYSLQCGVMNPGLFFSSMAVTLIAVRLLGGFVFEIYTKERIISFFLLVAAAALAILSLSTTLPLFILVGMLWGTAMGYLIPVSMAYALEYAGSSDGTAIGTYQAFMDIGLALGPAAMGMVVHFAGYRYMFLCSAFVCLVNLGFFLFYLRKRGKSTRAA